MSKNTLTITDNRTGKNYELPITDGSIPVSYTHLGVVDTRRRSGFRSFSPAPS